nr:PREDICTED: odorant receptor Or1-like [Tribolium castaneum]|eukprot:XP_015839893.1 PREDICTED: odorant receptor Or1-like [Tribolium castaneum]
MVYFAVNQLKVLKDNLEYLENNSETQLCFNLTVKHKTIYKKITMCIEHHNAILDFIKYYENVYSPVVFTQFTAAVLVICISCLQLSMVEPLTFTFFAMITFIVTMFLEIFLYCYFGAALYEESNTIIRAVYMGNWYTYDIKSRKALIVLMERAKRPIIITAGKILEVSLETFTMLIRRAYSLLAVLRNYHWAVTPIAKGISKLPVEMWLPYDVNKDDKTYYLTYLFVVTGTANGAIASGVIDPLIAGLACQATGQLRILKNNLQYLWENVDKEISDSEKDNALREKIMYDKIRSCILHHNSILNYVELFEDTYSSVVFTQFTASVLVICNACLQISMVEPFTFAFFAMISFIVTMLAEIFLYSYYGTLLYDESNSLTNAIYMGRWYEYDIKSKKALIVIMERSKKPMIVTAGKILDLSLVTFTTILRRAYSLLAVLKNY